MSGGRRSARPAPPDDAWRVWVLLAGRGFGKTRAGAEWVSDFARHNGQAAVALVAVLFETGRARFAGAFPELEDELAGFTAKGWRGAGASPDRADAMIWAMTELAVKPPRTSPRVALL